MLNKQYKHNQPKRKLFRYKMDSLINKLKLGQKQLKGKSQKQFQRKKTLKPSQKKQQYQLSTYKWNFKKRQKKLMSVKTHHNQQKKKIFRSQI